MSRTERARLADIATAIAAIDRHRQTSEGGSGRDAVLHQLVVIGEAVKHLSQATRAREPNIPWSDIAGLRDLIAHEYFRIDDARIDQIIERDLPALRDAVARLLTNA